MKTPIQTLQEERICESAMQVLQESSVLLHRQYLPQLEQHRVIPVSGSLNTGGDVRLFCVERIVLEKRQAVLESLTAAYTALGAAGFSVFLCWTATAKKPRCISVRVANPTSHRGKQQGNCWNRHLKGIFQAAC